MPPPQLSVVVPAYNEAAGIAETVRLLAAGLDVLGRAWEIIVVDNASTDGTPEQLVAWSGDPRVTVLRNESNRGKGYSMRRGMLAAGGELRLHCDADCAGSLVSLPSMLALVELGADVVVGSRLAAGAALGRRQGLPRRIVGRSFVTLCRLVLREPTRDLYCGFKLWRAAPAQDAYQQTRLEGWVFDAEVLAMARALGYDLREVGIAWNDREGSRLSMARTLLPAVRDLARARRRVSAVALRTSAGTVAGAEG